MKVFIVLAALIGVCCATYGYYPGGGHSYHYSWSQPGSSLYNVDPWLQAGSANYHGAVPAMYQNPYAYAPVSYAAPQYTYQVIPQAPAIAPHGVKGAASPAVPLAPGLQKNKKHSKVNDSQQKVEQQQTVDVDEQQQQQVEEPVEQQQQVEEAVKGDRKTARRDHAKGERKGVKSTTERTVIERKEADKKVETKIEKDDDDVSVSSKESSRTVSEDKETNADGFTRRKRSFHKHN